MVQKDLIQDASISELELESRYAEENKKIQKELVGLLLLMCFSLYFVEIKVFDETSSFIYSIFISKPFFIFLEKSKLHKFAPYLVTL
jgi:hypothetical protein